MKFFVIKINWFIDETIGNSSKVEHTVGDDIVIFNGEESEIILFAEDLSEAWCQASRFSHYILNYNSKKIETISNMEARYWTFDNVNNFGLVDYEILASYSLKDFEEKFITDELVYDAIKNKNFYSF